MIWIDDLQWADADSMVLLEEILGGAAAPAMLTLLTFRSEEVAAKPFLRTLLDRDGRRGWSAVLGRADGRRRGGCADCRTAAARCQRVR